MGVEIISRHARPTVVPVVTAVAYTIGDALGGKMEFLLAVRDSGDGQGPRSGLLHGIQIVDLAKQGAAIDIVLFNQDFTGGTDNAVFDAADAELPNVIDVIHVLGADYSDFNDNSIATKSGLSIAVLCAGDSLFAQAVIRSAATYAVGDIRITPTIIQD